jgi:hypothetical protein
MKHIKLFEAFGQMGQGPALIVAKGDWTGITKTGEAEQWTVPKVIDVEYYENPTPEQISQIQDASIFTPEEAAAEIIGGDQGGNNLSKDNQEGLAFLVDRSKGPEEIERMIQDMIDVFNEGGDTGADQFYAILEMPDAQEEFTPQYLAHCRACLAKGSAHMRNLYKKHQLPGGNDKGSQKLMKRTLNFQVV